MKILKEYIKINNWEILLNDNKEEGIDLIIFKNNNKQIKER